MLNYLKSMFFDKPQPSPAPLIDPVLMQRLDGFLRQSVDVNLIGSIRNFKISLLSVYHARIYIEERLFAIDAKNYFQALCKAHHSSFLRQITAIENAKMNIINKSELLELKNTLIEEAYKHIVYLCLIMAEVIEASVQSKLVQPKAVYDSLVKNIADINLDNIYDKFILAENKLGELIDSKKLSDQEIIEIASDLKGRIAILAHKITVDESNGSTLYP